MTTRQARGIEQRSSVDALPNPPKIPDMQQREQLYRIDSALRSHFAGRSDVLVSGEGYLRNDPYDPSEQLAPDCVVAYGVKPDAIIGRNGYVINEVGKPPDFVLEVASRSTGRQDYTTKRDGYARYGVQEYWRFDETGGRFHDAALAGDTLVDGEYVPIPIERTPDGVICGHSEILGLDICWDRGRLRFYDPAAGRYLPNAEELKGELDAERIGRLAAEARASEAEAMISQLREQLRDRQQ